MDLLKKIDYYYFLANLKLAQVIDKTKAGPMGMDPYSDRIVASDKEVFDLTPRKYAQRANTNHNKPEGVWYSIGSQWIVHREIEGGYAYRIKIDATRLLKLGAHNIEKFIETYKTDIKGEDVARFIGVKVDELPEEKRQTLYLLPDKTVIDWGKVAANHTGVEIVGLRDIPHELRFEWDFLGSWDVDSGCIFDTSIIKSADKLGEIPTLSTEQEYRSPAFSGYWEEDAMSLKRVFEDRQGSLMGSRLDDMDRKFLSGRLTQYNVHLTADQLKDVEFFVSPKSITLKKVPDAPSYEGKSINL